MWWVVVVVVVGLCVCVWGGGDVFIQRVNGFSQWQCCVTLSSCGKVGSSRVPPDHKHVAQSSQQGSCLPCATCL